MSAKNYLQILQGGIILSLFFVLFVFPSLLFPYISSKQLLFNVLIEILMVFWLVFIWKYKAYRPKLNLIIYGLLAYFLVILISSFTGVDFNLSFWGDVERMLGFFHIFHFLIFFFILISAFRNWKDYKLLLITSISIATLVSLIGLLGVKPHSTIGNTTYVSGYLIFNLFFSAILFIRTRNNWRYAYFIPVIIMMLEFKNMRTSGAIIGLAAGVFLAIILVGLLHKNKKIKYALLTFSILALLSVGFIFSQQQSSWFQNSFLKNLTSQKTTFQTRLLSWKSAWLDFGNHPILGTGYGNYAIIFDRHFDPIFFNYDKNETYFDRAHNNLIDITSTTGVLGLLSYLSIFIFVLFYLIRIWKENGRIINNDVNGRRNLELVLIISLLLAYFIQNLAVFDSFVTYIGLMITLGFIYWLINEKRSSDSGELTLSVSYTKGREKIFLLVLLLIVLIFTNKYNLGAWRMLQGSIVGYSQIANKDIVEGFDTFKKTLNDTPLERDSRSSLINLVSSNPVILSTLVPEKAEEEFNYLVSLASKNLDYNPYDNLFIVQLAQLYDLGARIFYDNVELRNEYSDLSLQYANRAIDSSPGRIPVYFSKAQALLLQGKTDEAISTLEYAANLNQNYTDTYCRLGQVYLQEEKNEKAKEALMKCIDGGSVKKVGGANSLINTAQFFAEEEDYPRTIIVLERLVEVYDTDPNMWMNLAKLYMQTEAGDEKVRHAANQAVVLDPSFIDQAEALFE